MTVNSCWGFYCIFELVKASQIQWENNHLQLEKGNANSPSGLLGIRIIPFCCKLVLYGSGEIKPYWFLLKRSHPRMQHMEKHTNMFRPESFSVRVTLWISACSNMRTWIGTAFILVTTCLDLQTPVKLSEEWLWWWTHLSEYGWSTAAKRSQVRMGGDCLEDPPYGERMEISTRKQLVMQVINSLL